MRQEINLLKIDYKSKLPTISFIELILILFFLIFILSITSWYSNNYIKYTTDYIDKNYTGDVNVIVNNNINKLNKIEKQLLEKYKLLINYKNIIFLDKKLFSKYFMYIANLTDEKISLYEIDIYNYGYNISIKGFSKKIKEIPTYINKLKKQEEFKKIKFGELYIEKLKNEEIVNFYTKKYNL